MAGQLIGGASLEAAFHDLQTLILNVIKTTATFKSTLQRLEATLLSIKPMFDDVERLGEVLNRRHEGETDMFVHRMRDGEELVLKSSKVKRWNFYKKFVYSKKLMEFDESLTRFFQIDVQVAKSVYIRQILLTLNTGEAQ